MSLKIQTLFDELITIMDPAIFVAGALFIMVFLLWLILRPLNYWYWKIEERDRLLENMDKQLAELRHSQRRNERTVQGEEILRAICDVREAQKQEAVAGKRRLAPERAAPECATEPADKGEQGEESEHLDAGSGADAPEQAMQQAKRRYSTVADAVDKNGKVHMQEDIEKLIRF